MRTTITLDSDIEALVREAMQERRLSFKEAVNQGLRAGLTQSEVSEHGFVQRTVLLGSEQNFRWDKALAAADAIEDEEISRKLSLRK